MTMLVKIKFILLKPKNTNTVLEELISDFGRGAGRFR